MVLEYLLCAEIMFYVCKVQLSFRVLACQWFLISISLLPMILRGFYTRICVYVS